LNSMRFTFYSAVAFAATIANLSEAIKLQPEDDFAQIDAFQTVAKGASPIIGGKPVVAKPKIDPTAPLKVEEVTKKPEPVQPTIGGK